MLARMHELEQIDIRDRSDRTPRMKRGRFPRIRYTEAVHLNPLCRLCIALKFPGRVLHRNQISLVLSNGSEFGEAKILSDFLLAGARFSKTNRTALLTIISVERKEFYGSPPRRFCGKRLPKCSRGL
jgi:hypothetical protein